MQALKSKSIMTMLWYIYIYIFFWIVVVMICFRLFVCLFVCLLLLLCAFYVRVDTVSSRNGMNKYNNTYYNTQ